MIISIVNIEKCQCNIKIKFLGTSIPKKIYPPPLHRKKKKNDRKKPDVLNQLHLQLKLMSTKR